MATSDDTRSAAAGAGSADLVIRGVVRAPMPMQGSDMLHAVRTVLEDTPVRVDVEDSTGTVWARLEGTGADFADPVGDASSLQPQSRRVPIPCDVFGVRVTADLTADAPMDGEDLLDAVRRVANGMRFRVEIGGETDTVWATLAVSSVDFAPATDVRP